MLIKFNEYEDPLIDAIYLHIEEEAKKEKPRSYVGASSIGDDCEKKLWYQLRKPELARERKAPLILAANDGHRGEDLFSTYMRQIEGINLITHGANGKQLGFSDLDGMFKGHCDGLILGLPQAPKTQHVWEHKVKKETGMGSYNELLKLKEKYDIKEVLAKWNYTYYCQAVIYMHYFDCTRHYTTVALAGSRKFQSIRTNANPQLAKQLIAKAKRIIAYTSAPIGISNNPTFWKCKFCDFAEECHK